MTPLLCFVDTCRHYRCPFGVHSDASGLLRRALFVDASIRHRRASKFRV